MRRANRARAGRDRIARAAGPSPPVASRPVLAWAEAQDGRFELVEGTVVMHAGATRDHERVAKRVFVALHTQCDGSVFDVNKGDFGVRIRPGQGRGSIFYPDVVVDLQSGDGNERATTTPVVVIEVLSASTGYDSHLDKFEGYKGRDSLGQYVVLEQDVPRACLWLKGEAGWPASPAILECPGATLDFPALGAAVSLAEIYDPGPGRRTP